MIADLSGGVGEQTEVSLHLYSKFDAFRNYRGFCDYTAYGLSLKQGHKWAIFTYSRLPTFLWAMRHQLSHHFY